jgi:hypothetical protein
MLKTHFVLLQLHVYLPEIEIFVIKKLLRLQIVIIA